MLIVIDETNMHSSNSALSKMGQSTTSQITPNPKIFAA
jgi:hypothetical protein